MSTSAEVTTQMARGGRVFLTIVALVQLLGAAGAALANGVLAEEITQPMWEFPGVVWIRYPLVGVGASLGTAAMAIYVAHGVTRRDFLAGAARYALFVCALLAALGVAAFGLERLVYELGGWNTEFEGYAPFTLFVTYLLLFGAYAVSGALIGAAYARWSTVRATWMITPLVLPIVVAEALLSTWWGGLTNRESIDPWVPLSVAAPVIAVTIAVGTWLAYVLLRDVAIKPKKG